MIVEWVLEANGAPATFRFEEKLKVLAQAPAFPSVIETRSWLKDRVVGLYRELEPLRGTIIHDRYFTSADGNLQVSSSKRQVVGPQISLPQSVLRLLALTTVSLLRYIEGVWVLNEIREKTLRHELDELGALHGYPALNQKTPFYTTVRVFSEAPDPREVDLPRIRQDLAAHYADRDCMFDVRVLLVNGGEVADAFMFPWDLVRAGGAGIATLQHLESYRVQKPEDVREKHIRLSGAG
jgi:hypothetical protein